MTRRDSLSLALYRRLAAAFPHEFRMNYGDDLDLAGEDAIPSIGRRYGWFGLARLLFDIALSLPAAYLSEIRQDVAYALRVLAKAPGFTLIATLSLAIGIGMCCVVFCECQSLTAEPRGIARPGELAAINGMVSYPYFREYRRQPSLASPGQAAAFIPGVPFAVVPSTDRAARAQRFFGHLVSPEYFSALGVSPAAGRFFSTDADLPGISPVVVISHRFWRLQLASDPNAVGRVIRVNGAATTIVGIAPRDFLGLWPVNPGDLFVPVTRAGAIAPELAGNALELAGRDLFRFFFRRAPGLSLAGAEATLDSVTRNLDLAYGRTQDRDTKGHAVRLISANTNMLMTADQRIFLDTFNYALWALVLALTCTNLANLQLARAANRRKEIAVRLSIGASRFRLLRQLLTESVLLSLAGALLGLVFARWMTGVLASLRFAAPNIEFDLHPDFRIAAITLAIAIAAGIGFGLTPGLAAIRTDIGTTLKAGAQAPLRGYRRLGIRNLFIAVQVAASLTLLLITWYIGVGFLKSALLDPGFQVANLDLVSIDPVRDGYSAAQCAALYSALPAELSRAAGIRHVSLTGGVPFGALGADQPNTQMSAPEPGSVVTQHAVFRERIGADYFATLGVPLEAGREFDRRDIDAPPADASAAAIPVIVNQSASAALFGSANPIGRPIREGDTSYVVVGLARDLKSGIVPPKPVPSVFLPLTAEWFRAHPTQRATLLIRGANGRDALASARAQLAARHPDLSVFNLRTLQDDLDQLNAFVRWDASIYVVLGVLALVLACIGLGGVTAYAVARRRKEIGIRMALGARTRQVRTLVLREGIVLVVAGIAAGFGGAAVLWRALTSHLAAFAELFATPVSDPMLLLGVPAMLAAMVLAACYLPARRVTQIDPMSALREE